MRRWFYLLGHMIINQNAVHCIEEIDVTFHTEAYQDLARFLLKYATMYNNQLFITSHNIEFIDVFLQTLYAENGPIGFNDDDSVRIFTIKPSDIPGQPQVWPSTGREAFENRRKYNLELRG